MPTPARMHAPTPPTIEAKANDTTQEVSSASDGDKADAPIEQEQIGAYHVQLSNNWQRP